MADSEFGLLLLLVAGAMNGSFTLPMKFTRRWEWENTWLVWTIFALTIFPAGMALLTIPSLNQVYGQTGITVLVAMFGASWGISQIFLGLAVDEIGMALSFSVILGLSAAVGSILPLLRMHPEAVFQRHGILVLCGVAMVLLGVGIAAAAGRRREAALIAAAGSGKLAHKASLRRGLLFATISGLGSALVNLGFTFGDPLKNAAQQFGAPPIWSANAVWLPFMVAGGIPNLLYCIWLLRRNHSAIKFKLPRTRFYWGLSAIMALLWFGGIVIYGVGATILGELGPVFGWPLFMSIIVITGTVWGLVTGEWKGTGKGPLRLLASAVVVLVVAIFILGFSSRL